jgi:hypothetical protein|tara:strand:- start:506 stop:835 length:330 start_codon:yes stop_codon:yes gene_type:complete
MSVNDPEKAKDFQLSAIADRAVFHDPNKCRQTRKDLKQTTWENLYFHSVVSEPVDCSDARGRKIAALVRYELDRRERVAARSRAIWAAAGGALAGAAAAIAGVIVEKLL